MKGDKLLAIKLHNIVLEWKKIFGNLPRYKRLSVSSGGRNVERGGVTVDMGAGGRVIVTPRFI